MSKILIVEDDPYVFELYKRLFSFTKHEIDIAHNGQEGVEKAEAMVPDLIMLDIMMPVMDGITALEKLKKNSKTKDIPVIMLTNIDDSDSFSAAKRLGAADYMVKSDFTPDQVLEKCEGHLANAKAQKS